MIPHRFESAAAIKKRLRVSTTVSHAGYGTRCAVCITVVIPANINSEIRVCEIGTSEHTAKKRKQIQHSHILTARYLLVEIQ